MHVLPLNCEKAIREMNPAKGKKKMGKKLGCPAGLAGRLIRKCIR